jgi:poly(3-hydroxybutyrate) depolymerase
LVSLRWGAGLAGFAVLACLSELDERKLRPGEETTPAGGGAGVSSGGAAGAAGSGLSGGGGGASAGSAGSAGTAPGSGGSSGAAGGEVISGGTGGDAGGGSGSECSGGLLPCDETCVDAMTDNAHCGACDRRCSAGSTCVGGECACGEAQTLCDDGCVNTLTDVRNCGGCGQPCAADQSCVDGECACAGGLTPCSDGCVDTNSSSAHCGACEEACEAGQVCSAGTCAETCSGSEVQCGNDCADTSSSSSYCGDCETECTGVDVCVAGDCVCPGTQAKCDERCVDTMTDNEHCGSCDLPCAGGQSCVDGECRCPQGQSPCDGSCKNLLTDSANCGGCGTVCGSSQSCDGGECSCPDGQIAWNGECFHGSPGCNTQRSLQNGSHSLQSSGNTRSYVLRAPSNYDSARPYRLVLAYHPLGTTALQIDAGGGSSPSPYYGHLALSQSDTIFVAPQSLNNGSWSNTNNQDVIFTDAVLAAVGGALCIDERRVFATGFSVGASMSYALACARADVLRGVAAFSGGPLSGCNGGTSPVAFYASHGVGDATIAITSGRQLRDKFVQLNGCQSQSPPEPASGSGTYRCTSYAGCTAEHPVEWCAFDGDHVMDPINGGQSWNPARSWSFITHF